MQLWRVDFVLLEWRCFSDLVCELWRLNETSQNCRSTGNHRPLFIRMHDSGYGLCYMMSLPVAPHCLSGCSQKCVGDFMGVCAEYTLGPSLLDLCMSKYVQPRAKQASHFIEKAASSILEETGLVEEEEEEGNSQTTLHSINRNLKTARG